MAAAILIFLISILCLSNEGYSENAVSVLMLPYPQQGPESSAFDSNGEGPYTGVAGKVLKYMGPHGGFVEFATTPQKRTNCNNVCADPAVTIETCGRTLGLGFDKTGNLYMADASNGLMVVGPKGGLATPVATSSEGKPFNFLAGLDVDPKTGIVYFTEASRTYQLRDLFSLVLSKDKTGSLFKYDPASKKVTTLLTNLSGATGVAASKDGSYVLVSEYLANRILKYWLKGPKANTAEELIRFPGGVDNIKMTAEGDFWVAVNVKRGPPSGIGNGFLYNAFGMKISGQGQILKNVSLAPVYGAEAINEVQEYDRKLFICSMHLTFIGAVLDF